MAVVGGVYGYGVYTVGVTMAVLETQLFRALLRADLSAGGDSQCLICDPTWKLCRPNALFFGLFWVPQAQSRRSRPGGRRRRPSGAVGSRAVVAASLRCFLYEQKQAVFASRALSA